MKEIIRAFKKASTTFNPEAFYLFMVDKSSTGNAGYMPRKHRYGFIYMGTAGDKPQTIAHELGHGAFRLQHTFEEYPTIAETTQNLMDYGSGTTLRKYQWDLIHNPPIVIGLVEDLGEGAMKRISKELLAELLANIKDANIANKSRYDLNIYEGYVGDFFDVSLNNIELNYISVEIDLATVIDPNPTTFSIKPSEINKISFSKENDATKYLKYRFYPLNEDDDNFDPNAGMANDPVLVIVIEDEQEIQFESYLYNIPIPFPGDPLVEMSIVHTITAPNSGGMFGCSRESTTSNCATVDIPNLTSYINREKVHGGVDVKALLNTKIYAMYSGIIEKIERTVPANTEGTKGSFGNRIRIKSTPAQHKILGNNNTIYIYYTHLNEVESGLTLNPFVKQGQKIGKTGSTGNAWDIPAWRYHTHINVYEGSNSGSSRVDPRSYFNTKFDMNGSETE